jgi:hypothetical protein
VLKTYRLVEAERVERRRRWLAKRRRCLRVALAVGAVVAAIAAIAWLAARAWGVEHWRTSRQWHPAPSAGSSLAIGAGNRVVQARDAGHA